MLQPKQGDIGVWHAYLGVYSLTGSRGIKSVSQEVMITSASNEVFEERVESQVYVGTAEHHM